MDYFLNICNFELIQQIRFASRNIIMQPWKLMLFIQAANTNSLSIEPTDRQTLLSAKIHRLSNIHTNDSNFLPVLRLKNSSYGVATGDTIIISGERKFHKEKVNLSTSVCHTHSSCHCSAHDAMPLQTPAIHRRPYAAAKLKPFALNNYYVPLRPIVL